MKTDRAPDTVRAYLDALQNALKGSSPGLISDALALERAGVKHERPVELVRLREAERAADAAIRDVQRELRDIDEEIKLRPRPGRGARFGRTARLARAAR